MTNTITFRWSTGNIEIAACAVLDMTASQLRNLVKTATANSEEVKNQIADYIQSEIDKLNPKSEYDKKMIAQYNKLISAACGERRQTAQEKAIARIMKNCNREAITGVFHDADMYCVLDGYRLVRYAAPLENMPTAPQSLDTNKTIGDKSRYTVQLVLPTVKELKSDMKIAKLSGVDVNHIHIVKTGKRMDFTYDFGYGLPMVNAKYLIDMIEALPDAAAYAVENYASYPIYFTDGENDGILLPIRKMREYAAPEEKAAPTVEEKPIEKPVEEAKADPATAAEEVKTADNKPSAPVVPTVKNLSQFKKAIAAGYAFKIVKHYIKPELSGQIRQPSKVQTNAFYSVVYGEPNNPVSLANGGKGYYLNYGKAGDWDFTGDTIKMLCGDNPVWEITFDLSYAIYETPADNEQVEQEAADLRVAAVAHVVNGDSAHIPEYIEHYIDAYRRGMITEDEAKDALLRYTVPLALPAHEEAAQDMVAPEIIQIAAVNVPAVLRRSGRHYRRLQYNTSFAKNLLEIFKIVCTSLNRYAKIDVPLDRRKTQCQLKPQSDNSVMMPRPP